MIMLVGDPATFVVIAAVMVPALIVVRHDRLSNRARSAAGDGTPHDLDAQLGTSPR